MNPAFLKGSGVALRSSIVAVKGVVANIYYRYSGIGIDRRDSHEKSQLRM
jgi:hypothetical protein